MALNCAAECASWTAYAVLFYSGAAYDDDMKRAIEAGANAYVTKPTSMVSPKVRACLHGQVSHHDAHVTIVPAN